MSMSFGWTDTDATGGSGLGRSDVPAWMSSSKKASDEESPPTDVSASGSTDLVLTPIESLGKNMQPKEKTPLSKSQLCCCGMVSIVSLSFLGAFVFLAVHLGGSNLYYKFLFAAMATVPATFLMHYWVCFPNRLIYLYATAMAIWAVVVLIMQTIRLVDAIKDKNTFLMEHAGWYVAGASLGIISSLYHMAATNYTMNSKKKKEESEY